MVADCSAAEIHIQPVSENVFMLVGPVGNSTVQVGSSGVLIVDTQFAPLSDKIIAAIRTLSSGPIRYVLNAHAHPDHTGGNAPISRAGSTIAGGNVSGAIRDAGVGAAIVAHENVLFTMTAQEPEPSFAALPTDTYFTRGKDI